MLWGALLAACIAACGRSDKSATVVKEIAAPVGHFCADSAYQYIADQVAFGPRVPGSAAHEACKEYLIAKLRTFAPDSIYEQHGMVTAYDGTVLPVTNIIAVYGKNKSRRVMLAAHYDTRPWADRESDDESRNTPIDGANDGGSGVAVLMEIARNFSIRPPEVGVDLAFFDVEDYGRPDFYGGDNSVRDDGWCLGSRFWSENPVPYGVNNMPVYGILLDMVGGRDAQFHYEYFSQRDGITPTIKVWSEAERIGHGDRFPRIVGTPVTDDHLNMINVGIPTTDIIENASERTGGFPATWHTHNDNLSNISLPTLQAVGETVLSVIYRENGE